MAQRLRHRPGVVPPRPARRRQRRAVPGAAQLPQVHCVFVFDTDILDPLPREDRRVEFIRESLVELDAGCARRCGRPGRADRAPRGGRRDPAAGARARRAGGVCQPRLRAAGHRARPQGARRAGAAGIALHTVKDQVIFERASCSRRPARPTPCSRPTRTPGWKVDAFTSSPTRWHATSTALARARRAMRARCRRWPRSALSPPTWRS
jgi:deoxyribodipyrimidine photo-lyase